jgi:methionyl-tRNA formyltransferase
MKVFRTAIMPQTHALAVGTVCTNGRDRLEIAAADGMVRLIDVQLAGKKRMSVRDLLNGMKYSFTSARVSI